MAETEQADLTTLTVELLSAFVSNNSVDSGELAGLIQTTYAALTGIDRPAPPESTQPEYTPAVSVRKSISSRDHIISLINGKPYKTLKRHLKGHGLTPSEYRERYELPRDYPMVAPSYSAHRRDVAHRLGLGRKSLTAIEATAEEPVVEALPEKPTPTTDAAMAATPAKPSPKPARATTKLASTKAPAIKKSAKPQPATGPRSKAGSAVPVEASMGEASAEDAAAPSAPARKSSRATTLKLFASKANKSAPAAADSEPQTLPQRRGRQKAGNAPKTAS